MRLLVTLEMDNCCTTYAVFIVKVIVFVVDKIMLKLCLH